MIRTAYRPTDPQIRHYWEMLRAIVVHFLGEAERECGPELAGELAECFTGDPGPAGTWAIKCRCYVNGEGTPDVDTLMLGIFVLFGGSWEPFCEAAWHVLMPREWAAYQCQTLALSAGMGIPDSPAALFA
jgi:hypothetical protein